MAACTVCIPTYKRAGILRSLLADLAAVSSRVDAIVVVDGDPESGEVRAMLTDFVHHTAIPPRIYYLRSRHANLAYQRYIGSQCSNFSKILVFLDDDIRIDAPDAIERLIWPLMNDAAVVATTARIHFPSRSFQGETLDSIEQARKPATWRALRGWGSSSGLPQGGITPVGTRVPVSEDGPEYCPVEWLHGGVMAFRRELLTPEFFSDSLFELTRMGCGLGEDTYLARMARSTGGLMYARRAVFLHPNSDEPKAYDTQHSRLAYAMAFSRRFVNDTMRGTAKPKLSDRIALLKSLGAGVLGAMLRWARTRNSRSFAFLKGYLRGARHALELRPRYLTSRSSIDWRADAITDLQSLEEIPKG